MTTQKQIRVFKDAVTHFASQGYLCIQVPTISLEITDGKAIANPAEGDESMLIPSDWIWNKHISGRLAMGTREQGYAILSQKGWNINKEAIKAAFLASTDQRGTWEQFEQHVNKFHQDIIKKTQKYVLSLWKRPRKPKPF